MPYLCLNSVRDERVLMCAHAAVGRSVRAPLRSTPRYTKAKNTKRQLKDILENSFHHTTPSLYQSLSYPSSGCNTNERGKAHHLRREVNVIAVPEFVLC